MKVKYCILALFSAFLILSFHSNCESAIDTSGIDKVLEKGVLDGDDLAVIDKFVAESVIELIKSKDFTEVSLIRDVILSRRSEQGQFAQQFSESALKHISSGLEQVDGFTDEDRRFRITVNLFILIDHLESPKLAGLALGRVNDNNKVIQYWAIHSVTNPGLAEKLKSRSENLKLVRDITVKLTELAESVGPENLALMSEFAGLLDLQQGEQLLLKIADVRIKGYAQWQVEDELLDAKILQLLYNKIASPGGDKAKLGRRFAQLYSYVMQKYIKDINGGNFLSTEEKNRLASVLIETEKSCISALFVPQATIRNGVIYGDVTSLLLEHSRLLGDETGPGLLGRKLKFDYGKDETGRIRTGPIVLAEKPAEKAVN